MGEGPDAAPPNTTFAPDDLPTRGTVGIAPASLPSARVERGPPGTLQVRHDGGRDPQAARSIRTLPQIPQASRRTAGIAPRPRTSPQLRDDPRPTLLAHCAYARDGGGPHGRSPLNTTSAPERWCDPGHRGYRAPALQPSPSTPRATPSNAVAGPDARPEQPKRSLTTLETGLRPTSGRLSTGQPLQAGHRPYPVRGTTRPPSGSPLVWIRGSDRRPLRSTLGP